MQGVDTDRIKQDGYWTVECAECGQMFDSKRSDASFCGAACRNRWARRPQKFQNALDGLEMMAREVERLAKEYSTSPRMFEAVRVLHKSIQGSLTLFEE